MYWSLTRVCPEFNLYVFVFDDVLAATLKKMALPNMTVITLAEFEDEELLHVKPTRTAGEYCWTCSSSTIYYCLTHFNIDHCTYIDADLYFYSNPQALIDEMRNDDVLITSHRYSPQYQSEEKAGKYCVQFMTFKNTPNGMHILEWWRNACLDWCYNVHWRREWQPTPVFLPGESQGQRSLVGYSPRGCKDLDMTERLTLSLPFI